MTAENLCGKCIQAKPDVESSCWFEQCAQKLRLEADTNPDPSQTIQLARNQSFSTLSKQAREINCTQIDRIRTTIGPYINPALNNRSQIRLGSRPFDITANYMRQKMAAKNNL